MVRHLAAVALVLVLINAGCRRPAPPMQRLPAVDRPKVNAAGADHNGLDDADRAEFYHLAEGSEVYPLEWLQALVNDKTGKPFLEDLEKMGFLRDDKNPHGLAVGLTAELARGLEPLGKMVGLNCAACHVGELTYKGGKVRIDGAPNFLDARTYFASLVNSTRATVEDPGKLLAFISRLKAERSDQQQAAPIKIRQAARAVIAELAEREASLLKDALAPALKKLLDRAKDEPPVKLAAAAPASPKEFRVRMLDKFPDLHELLDDAKLRHGPLAQLADAAERRNSVLHTLEEIYIGARLFRARVDYLQKLGLVGQDEHTKWGPGRVDAFGSARALIFEDGYSPRAAVSYPHLWNFERIAWLHYEGNTTSVMERNMGQALGVGAVFDEDNFASSLRPENLDRLERLASKITAPAWPEELFGKIDAKKAENGAKLFKEHCIKCHQLLEPGKDAPDINTKLAEVGTDPIRAARFADKLPKGKFAGMYFFEAIQLVIGKIKDKAYEDNNITQDQQKAFSKGRANHWRAPKADQGESLVYAARPLAAIWATAPYLHNGSVPTLDDLLKPAKDRPKTFYVGSREYDPQKLGYVRHVEAKEDNFDTSKPGNQNIGHEYGTSLTKTERDDLLEYLKDLGTPHRVPGAEGAVAPTGRVAPSAVQK